METIEAPGRLTKLSRCQADFDLVPTKEDQFFIQTSVLNESLFRIMGISAVQLHHPAFGIGAKIPPNL